MIYRGTQGCHGQGKVRENQKFFKVREKSGNFAKGQGKSQFLSKSVKSQGILFSGFVKFMETFSFGKKEVVVDRVMRSNGGFFGQSNAMRSKSREKRKEIENGEKNIDGLQKKLKLM